jgi:hypothetical protein
MRAQTAQTIQGLHVLSGNYNTPELITIASTSLDSIGSVRALVSVLALDEYSPCFQREEGVKENLMGGGDRVGEVSVEGPAGLRLRKIVAQRSRVAKGEVQRDVERELTGKLTEPRGFGPIELTRLSRSGLPELLTVARQAGT